MNELQAQPTSFAQVAAMNVAFNNPKGDFLLPDWPRIHRQCLNIADELGELFIAMGGNEETIKGAVAVFKQMCHVQEGALVDVIKVRDAMCDVQVFAMGGQHFLGVDGDADMAAVVGAVMTRFIKDDDDKAASIAKHAANGITDVYFEGEYPTMVMKSGSDQPDAPKGKFLKSASFREPVFPLVMVDGTPLNIEAASTDAFYGQERTEQVLADAMNATAVPAEEGDRSGAAKWPFPPRDPDALAGYKAAGTRSIDAPKPHTPQATAAQRAAGWGYNPTAKAPDPSDGGNAD